MFVCLSTSLWRCWMMKRQQTTSWELSSTSAGTELRLETCTNHFVQVHTLFAFYRALLFLGMFTYTVPYCLLPYRSHPEGANFRNVLDKAVQADQVVRDRYNAHCDMITLLCKPENELVAAIPSANPAKTLQGSEVSRSLLASLYLFVFPVDVKLNFLCHINIETCCTQTPGGHWFMVLSLLPTVAPFFILFAEFALCFTGDLKKLSKQN